MATPAVASSRCGGGGAGGTAQVPPQSRDANATGTAPVDATVDIGGVSYTHPLRVTSWVDDIKQWPEVSVANVVCYLVRSKACDLKEAEAFKSLDSYNYLQCGYAPPQHTFCSKQNYRGR